MRRLIAGGLLLAVALVVNSIAEEGSWRAAHRNSTRALSRPPKALVSQLPVRSKVTSPFGPRRHPLFHRKILHQGADFRAKMGQEIRNVLDGVVVHAGPRGGFGNAVYVYHPVCSRISVYAHLSKVRVVLGQNIHQGEIVGQAGDTGFATAVHLHFGVKTPQGKWLDPMRFLSAVPSYQTLALKARSDNAQASQVVASQNPSALNVAVRSAIEGPDKLLQQLQRAGQSNQPSHSVAHHPVD